MDRGGNQGRRGCCSSLFTSIVTGGLVVLIYWAIFQPHHIRATVASAELSNLTVAANGAGATASYALAVTLSLYNPSLRVNIYYDTLDCELRFRGQLLGHANGAAPAEFYQRRKSSDDVTVSFAGTGVTVPGELGKEKASGSVSLEVAVDARVRYRFGSIKIRQKPRIWCSLAIPVGAGGGGRLSSGERCSVKY
ncbi:uncharacterized protein At1g08160-like [Oryza brachyantha]|uniref:Late embryogenesis abundant protein LEA-2 subgroup domain-containing protein n=1 Tax=Oryza brachyantha TaxID=4533 RepID=J3NBJ9_ORYBR|nr:uncharacterized protein At1g08160-like [Oryza brachyantha]